MSPAEWIAVLVGLPAFALLLLGGAGAVLGDLS